MKDRTRRGQGRGIGPARRGELADLADSLGRLFRAMERGTPLPRRDMEFEARVDRVVAAKEERERRLADPATREAEERRIIEAGVAFVMGHGC